MKIVVDQDAHTIVVHDNIPWKLINADIHDYDPMTDVVNVIYHTDNDNISSTDNVEILKAKKA